MNRMSRSFLILALAILASFARVGSMAAQQLGTPDEAKAMLDRAIAALKSDESGALSKFNDPSDQQFHDRDLYILCFDVADGKITADSSNGLRGIDIRTLKLKDDPWGKELTTPSRARRERASVQWTTVSRSSERQSHLQSNSLRRGSAIRVAASPTFNNDRTWCCGGVVMLTKYALALASVWVRLVSVV